MSAEGGTAGYIQHHLTNLAVCLPTVPRSWGVYRFLDLSISIPCWFPACLACSSSG